MAQLPNIVILGDYERALRRFSKWEKLEQQAVIFTDKKVNEREVA